MASKTVVQYYVDGTARAFLRKKQGRKTLPVELVKIPITAMVIPATKARLQEKAKAMNLSLSAYAEMALVLFEIKRFSSEENRSIQ